MWCIICRNPFLNVFVAARKAIYRNCIVSRYGLHHIRCGEVSLSWLSARTKKDEDLNGLQGENSFLPWPVQQSNATHTIETCRSDLQPQVAL